MAGTGDINIPTGQGHAIPQVGRSRQQTLEQRRLAAARKRKDKKKKNPPDKFTDSKATGSEQTDSGQGKDSKARGGLFDVVI